MYDQTTTPDSSVGNGSLRLSNTNVRNATSAYLKDFDSNGNDWADFYDAIDAIDNTSQKAYMQIAKRNSPSDFVLYKITDISDGTTIKTFTIAEVASSSTTPFSTPTDPVFISFSVVGDRGDAGSSGSSGVSGSSGSSGAAGSSGSSGAAGSSGTSGSSGSSGTGSIQSIATGNGITGGTITTTGTIEVDYSTGSDNLIFSAPAVTSVTAGTYAPYINVAESNPGVSYDIVERIRLSDIRLDMWDEPTGDVNLSYEKIINLASPTISTDAANKTYVDANDLVSSFTNGADNRLITATSTTGINGEANLIFNSSSNSLTISAGGLHVGSGITPTTVGIGQFTNDVIAYYSSDRRLKENITPIPNALDKVMAINGVTFDWIPLSDEQRKTLHPNEGHDIGIIAQEIEAVLPEVVTTRETGFKAVKYEKIVALLIEAIKEQQTQIDELKRKI